MNTLPNHWVFLKKKSLVDIYTCCKLNSCSEYYNLILTSLVKHNANVLSVHNESESENVTHLVLFHSLGSHGLQPTRLLCPWNSPGKNTGVGCHFLLQGIFLTLGSNPGLLHSRQILYCLSHCFCSQQQLPNRLWAGIK